MVEPLLVVRHFFIDHKTRMSTCTEVGHFILTAKHATQPYGPGASSPDPHTLFRCENSYNMMSTANIKISKPVRLNQTCDVCKSRHQKCSGTRPSCANCELRNLQCVYSEKSASTFNSVAKSTVLSTSYLSSSAEPRSVSLLMQGPYHGNADHSQYFHLQNRNDGKRKETGIERGRVQPSSG